MKTVSVRSLPLHSPVILKNEKSLREAALAMERNQVSSVLISDGHGSFRGVFTDRDLALTLALKNMTSSVPLSEVAPQSLLYVTETATLEDVIDLMKKNFIRRVPVVHDRPNGKQICLGIISLDDLIKEGLIDRKDEQRILKSQLNGNKERQGRGRVRNALHSQAHKEQSIALFVKTVSDYTNLSREKSRELIRDSLTLILRRLTVKSGKSLLAQLPYTLQMELIHEVGPVDRTIDGALLLEQIQKAFKVKSPQARALLQSFWRALGQAISAGEIKKLQRDLPKDMAFLYG